MWCGARSDDRRIAWLGVMVICFGIVLSVTRPIVNGDLGWHLALGRYISEAGSIPDTEIFTHTAKGAPMVAHEWLSQVAMYQVVDAWGFLGVRWLCAALASIVVLILFAWLRRDGVPPALALLGTLAYVAIAQGRFQVRPHMFHLAIFIALYGYLFIHRPKLRPRELVGIIFATAVWLNIHSAGLIFPALVGLYVAVEFLQQLTGWRQPEPSDLGEGKMQRLAVLAIGVSVASLITPHHFQLFPYVLESFEVNTRSSEWNPITSDSNRRAHTQYSIEAFWIVGGLTWLMALATVRRVSSSLLAVVLTLSFMPLLAQRHLSFYFAPVLFSFGELARWLRVKSAGRPRAVVQSAVSMAALVTVLVATTRVLNYPNDLDWIGRYPSSSHNFSEQVFPIGAVHFLNRVQLESRLYHPTRWGGYIEWETHGRYPSFSDGRWITIGNRIMQDSLSIEVRGASTFSKLEEYGIDLLLVPRGWMEETILWEQGWLTLFENITAGVYLRKAPETRADLERVREYYVFEDVPFDPVLGFDEQIAYQWNRSWARRFRVQRTHLDQFRMSTSTVVRHGGNRIKGW
jgi:hypothetical protein